MLNMFGNEQTRKHNHHHQHTFLSQQKQEHMQRMRQELTDYYYTCLHHKEISTKYYDYYMDFGPSTVRRCFSLLFHLNKLFRLVLVHFLFYHSNWWSSNSTNLAVNYSLIDIKLFLILLYLNFHEFLVNGVLINLFIVRVVLARCGLAASPASLGHVRRILASLELLLYAACAGFIFYFLKFRLDFSYEMIALFIVPHGLFLFYSHFDLNLSLFNICFFSNLSPYETPSHSAATGLSSSNLSQSSETVYKRNIQQHGSELTSKEYTNAIDPNQSSKNSSSNNNNNNKYVYTDCSNISINSYLTGKIATPKLFTKPAQIGEQANRGHSKSTATTRNSKTNTRQSASSAPASSNLASVIMASSGIASAKKQHKFTRANLFHPLYLLFYHLPSTISLPCSSPRTVVAKRNTINLSALISGAAAEVHHSASSSPSLSSFRSSYSTSTRQFTANQALHCCEKSAQLTRDETDLLRADFNSRLTEVMVRALENVYTNFILTRLCLPASLNVRERDFFLYFSASLVCAFLAHWLYHMPPSFLVSLSRNAEHLGEWSLESARRSGEAAEAVSSVRKWTPTRVYFRNERALYMGKIYRVSSVCTASVPSNKKYKKFFRLFSNPFRIVCALMALKLVNIGLLGAYTLLSQRWYAILTNLVEILFNSHTFFVIFRDFFLFSSAASGQSANASTRRAATTTEAVASASTGQEKMD